MKIRIFRRIVSIRSGGKRREEKGLILHGVQYLKRASKHLSVEEEKTAHLEYSRQHTFSQSARHQALPARPTGSQLHTFLPSPRPQAEAEDTCSIHQLTLLTCDGIPSPLRVSGLLLHRTVCGCIRQGTAMETASSTCHETLFIIGC